MDRRTALRAGAVAALGATAGCMNSLSPIAADVGRGVLHPPEAVRIDGETAGPDDPAGAVVVDDPDRVTGEERVVEFVAETDLSARFVLVVQVVRPASEAVGVEFGPSPATRAGALSMLVEGELDPWGTVPEELADEDDLAFTLATRFERPRALVPRSATVELREESGSAVRFDAE